MPNLHLSHPYGLPVDYKNPRTPKSINLQLELEVFEGYWQGAASIPSVVLRTIPEDSTRISELVTGGVNIATNVLPEAIPLIESSGAAEIRTVQSIRNIFIVFTATEEGPLADARVRRALNLAVDVDAIIESVFGGNATPTATPLNNYMFGYAEDLDNRRYDPEQAQRLLAEAGYEYGFSFTMGSPSGRYLNDHLVAEAVVGQLAEIGVQVESQVQEWSSYVGQVLERQVPTGSYLIGWGNSNYDADRTLFTMLYGGTVGGGPDQAVFSYFQNDEFARLIIAEAALSFLGLSGVAATVPSWSQMLSEGREVLFFGGWWVATFPGVASTLVVLAVNLFGDVLGEALDPRGRA